MPLASQEARELPAEGNGCLFLCLIRCWGWRRRSIRKENDKSIPSIQGLVSFFKCESRVYCFSSSRPFFYFFFCAHQIVVLSSPFPVTSPKRKASLSSIQAVAAILPSYTDIIIIIIYIHGLSFSIYQYLIRRAG